MLFRWCVKIAGVVAVGGLLTIAEGLAQQPRLSEARLTKSVQTGGETNTVPQPAPPQALFLPNAFQLTPLDEAYLDAFSILKEDNICSAFYGGSQAIEVLNELKQQLKSKYLNSFVAARMTGKTRNLISLRYPLAYRLFDRAELNANGPFYNGNAFNSRLANIGSFLPNTREARVTILLHELGHLIKRPDKQCLLPNDGGNDHLSQENTKLVLAFCGEQVKQLNRISFAQKLQAARP